MSAATASLATQIRALDVAVALLPQLSRLDDFEGRDKLEAAIESALEGRNVFFYADGRCLRSLVFAASVHGLGEDEPLSSDVGESVFFRGSLIGFLFRGNRDTSPRVARRAKDALVGKSSAEMTHEDVRAYREFVEATQMVPSAILITERFAFAKTGTASWHSISARRGEQCFYRSRSWH